MLRFKPEAFSLFPALQQGLRFVPRDCGHKVIDLFEYGRRAERVKS
jgi:hypothetical protein